MMLSSLSLGFFVSEPQPHTAAKEYILMWQTHVATWSKWSTPQEMLWLWSIRIGGFRLMKLLQRSTRWLWYSSVQPTMTHHHNHHYWPLLSITAQNQLSNWTSLPGTCTCWPQWQLTNSQPSLISLLEPFLGSLDLGGNFVLLCFPGGVGLVGSVWALVISCYWVWFGLDVCYH